MKNKTEINWKELNKKVENELKKEVQDFLAKQRNVEKSN